MEEITDCPGLPKGYKMDKTEITTTKLMCIDLDKIDYPKSFDEIDNQVRYININMKTILKKLATQKV